MKRTRARFKHAQKVAKKTEETYRADALAANFDTDNIKGFWKCIKDYNTGQVAFSNTVHNASGPSEITSMWQQHFNELFNSVPDSNEKAKYCPIVKQISIPMQFLLQLLKYMRPYRSCSGTRHLDMMA